MNAGKKFMKALVTGGTGFIGSHLTAALVRKGVQVRCLLRKTSDLNRLKGLSIKWVYGDLKDKASLEKAVMGVDWVFHLAGVTRAMKTETYLEVNGTGTENLIRACVENNPDLQKFIYISSQSAAGPSRDGYKRRETDSCQPVSFYGRSKCAGEASVYSRAHELPVLILRPSSVYGPGDKDIFPFFKCISRRVKLCPRNSDHHLSLCYVEDIVDGILSAVEAKTKSGDVFFLSDGHDYRVDEIGDILSRAMGISAFRIRAPETLILGLAGFSETLSRVFRRPFLLTKDKAVEMTQKNWVCDITKAKTLLGFNPKVSLPEAWMRTG